MESVEEFFQSSVITIPLDKVYKVFRFDSSGRVSQIYVFSGGLKNETHMSELFREDQLAYIRATNVFIQFSRIQIHKDDSVRALKKKIIHEMGSDNISYDEIYLFGFVAEEVNTEDIFHDITKNDTIPVSRKAFAQIAENLDIPNSIVASLVKDSYDYEDLLQFEIGGTNGKSVSEIRPVKTCIGRRFVNRRNPLFSANPFKTSSQVFHLSVDDQFINFENELIFNYGSVIDQEIYLCPAKNVLEYFNNNQSQITDKYLINIYYPFLMERGIHNISKLDMTRNELLRENAHIVSRFTIQHYRTVDIFHQVYYNRTFDIPYLYRGIKTFSIILRGNKGKNIPLESIFKALHASAEIPYMVFNPGARKENLVRLFSEKISRNGKKIPFLSEPIVMRLTREIPKNSMINVYIKHQANDLIAGIDGDGNVYVSSETTYPMNIQDWDLIIASALNPFILSINNIIIQAGHMIPIFTSLHSKRIDVTYITYAVSLIISKDVSIKKRIPCISGIFDVIEDKLSIASLKFKRVENFQEMEAIFATITRVYNETHNPRDIITTLIEEFEITEEEAISKYEIYLNEHAQIHGKLVDNPGFPVIFSASPIDKTLTVVISNIVNVEYIDIIDVYLDTLFRMTQFPEKTRITKEVFADACIHPSRMGKNIDIQNKRNVEGVLMSPVDTASLILAVPEIQPIGVGFEEDDIEDDDYDEQDDEEGFLFEDYEYEEEDEELINKVGEVGSLSEDDLMNKVISTESPSGKEELNLDGMRIGNPSYFFTRMKEREPALILSKREGKYDAYARVCPANIDRQPVILTPEEKDNIDKNHPGSYEHALKYGSDPNNPNWYICPRYWCLKTNTSMTKDEVESGVCGGIIPKDSAIVPPGKYVYEFTSKNHVDLDGNYLNQTPGFLGKNTHPTHCLPCCFSREWDSKSQSNRRKECGYNAEEEEVSTDTIEKGAKKRKIDKNVSYIISVDIFPIQRSRWGFLPSSAQRFLQIDYDSIIYNMHYIKPDSQCLLRYGVEQTNSNTQSFIGCIADFYAYVHSLPNPPSVEEMLNILSTAITLDRFIRYHNGSLVATFRPLTVNIEDIDVTLHSDTVFYKSIDMGNETQVDFLENTVASFDNFIAFLHNSNEVVDHIYLWDAISDDNPNLIPGGANLVIMNVPNDDITDNIEILCPTNSYSSSKFIPLRQTWILIKQNTFYEPVYAYSESTQGNSVIKSYNIQSVPSSISRILNVIADATNKYCRPMMSRSTGVFPFRKNISSVNISEIVLQIGYEIESQVMNYQSKIIGLIVVIPPSPDSESIMITKERMFVPCLPSSMLHELTIVYMDDPGIWNDYQSTMRLLNRIRRESSGKILCSPKIKIVSEGMIIGILTETNQFIQISPPEFPEETINDGLRTLSGPNYIIADKAITVGRTRDVIRENEVRKIILESQFYTAFRALIRRVLNKYENRAERRYILETVSDRRKSYIDKLRDIVRVMKKILKNHIAFQDISMEVILSFGNITGCDEGSCTDKSKKFCIAMTLTSNEDSTVTDETVAGCVLIVPSKHLLSGIDNETVYYGRMADELVRYRRIQLFMFKPKIYLNITNTQFMVNKSEILMLQSSITHEYFKDNTVANANSFIHNATYENAEPNILTRYSNDVILSQQFKTVNVVERIVPESIVDEYMVSCVDEVRDIVGNRKNSIWVQSFPANVSEIFFNQTSVCSFGPIIFILQSHFNTIVSLATVKLHLCQAYEVYMERYGSKIIKILSMQGKKNISRQMTMGTLSIDVAINMDDYYITDLDLWIIFDFLKIPVIIFYSTKCKTFGMDTNWVFLGGSNMSSIYDSLYFVRSPAKFEKNVPYDYHIVNQSVKFREMGDMSIIIQNAISGNPEFADNIQSLESFLRKITFFRPQYNTTSSPPQSQDIVN